MFKVPIPREGQPRLPDRDYAPGTDRSARIRLVRSASGRQNARFLPCPAAMLRIRSFNPADLPALQEIQRQCYEPCLFEDDELVLRRLSQHPNTCWAAEDGEGLAAYLFCYHSRLGSITPLSGEFHAASEPDCLYLHDLAVAPRAGGRGLGPQLVAHALRYAEGQRFAQAALVSVQDSARFWQRLGFTEEPALDAAQRQVLASYPVPARYLVRRLG